MGWTSMVSIAGSDMSIFFLGTVPVLPTNIWIIFIQAGSLCCHNFFKSHDLVGVLEHAFYFP
jgi:hypothetical protein